MGTPGPAQPHHQSNRTGRKRPTTGAIGPVANALARAICSPAVAAGTLIPVAMEKNFEQLEVSLLLCPKCRVAQPVRKRLLICLPDGDKYEYLCSVCGSTCGDKLEEPPEGLGSLLR